MPHLRGQLGAEQPDSLFISDLKGLTAVYEVGVAALFQSALDENMSLRRQLLAAGLEPMTAASKGFTGTLANPPRSWTPASQDLLCDEDLSEFAPTPLGCKRRPPAGNSNRQTASDGTSSQRISDSGSDCEESVVPKRTGSAASSRVMPFEFPIRRSTSFSSDTMPRANDRRSLASFVKSFAFEAFISVVIIANCITEGLWAQSLSTGAVSSELLAAIGVAEHLFTATFTLEILLKWKALGWRAFKPVDLAGRSNFADMLLALLTGILPTWLVPALACIFKFDNKEIIFKALTMLRTVRLARLVRLCQRVPSLREAWLLVHGLRDSYRTLFWTCIVIFLVTYAFAIFGLATIVVPLQAQLAYVTDPRDVTMLTDLLQMMNGVDQMIFCLVQVLFADSYHAFVRPITKYIYWSWLFWYAYVAIACIALMNLVTAIVVDNAMETSRENHDHMVREKEAKRQKDIGRMFNLFNAIDTDGGGTLSWEEFSMSFDDPELGKIWTVLDIDRQDAGGLFQLLANGDGEITINEFTDALLRMSGVAQAKDMYRLQKMVASVISTLDALNASANCKLHAKGTKRSRI